jgi:5,10-methylene-tetrahydrofolate dehydrogenase/methenyl tetrahydrofolate cyclohydrolase
MAQRLEGQDLAASIRDRLRNHVDQLVGYGHRPTLATIHMGTDPGAATYVEMKQRDCATPTPERCTTLSSGSTPIPKSTGS